MARVFLALGANIGDSKQTIATAIALLATALADIRQAPLYSSKAFGYTDQADFVNTVVAATTNLDPLALLQFLQDVEQQLGRKKRFRWGPREIDIDIIFYDQSIIQTPALTIPHPGLTQRDFVLRPLHDLEPNLVDPISHKTIEQLLTALPPGNLTLRDS